MPQDLEGSAEHSDGLLLGTTRNYVRCLFQRNAMKVRPQKSEWHLWRAKCVMEINRYTPKRWPFWTPKIKAIPSSSAPIFMGQAPLGPPTSMTLKGPAKRSTAEKLSTGCQLWRTNSTAGLRSYRNLGWHRIESGKTHEFAKWVIAKWVTSPYPSPELLGFMDVHPPKDGRDHR